MSGDPTPEPGAAADAIVELSARLLFSFFRGAARLARRFDLPLDRFVELAQLAYFQEQRRRAPRDLGFVASKLGVSLRTAGTLNKKLKSDFLRPELEVEPLRALTDVLLDGPRSHSQLVAGLSDEDRDQVERAIHRLLEHGWLEVSGHEDPVYALQTELRSFVSDELDKRLDGLNHQLDVIVASVMERFVSRNDDTARARSWFFAAREEDVGGLIERTVKDLRHGAIDLEESALADGRYRRFGITLAVTPVEEDS